MIQGLSEFVHQAPGRAALAVLAAAGLVSLISWFGIVQAPRTPGDDGHAAGKSSPTADSRASTPTVPIPGASRQRAAGISANEPTAAPAALAIIPSFDIVRLEPNGDSVIAGRAAPGATIELLRDGEPYFRALADESGAFALVPPPLPPGSHVIVVQSIAPDGTRARSRDSVTVAIADDKTTPPLVAMTSPDKPTMVLSNPDRSGMPLPPTTTASGPKQALSSRAVEPATRPGNPPVGPRPEVSIAAIDAEEGGQFFVSGQAAPGATLRLYINETLIAPGTVGADGKLAFAINRGMKPGSYRIRLDDVDPVSGEVKSRAEVPYNIPVQIAVTRPAQPPTSVTALPQDAAFPGQLGPEQHFSERAIDAGTVLIPEINTAIVVRGDSLWRISHRTYGDGLRYTVIYGGNQDQIRDPNLIYPGQSFVLPPDNGQSPRG